MIWDGLLKDGEGAVARLLGRQETLTLEFKADNHNHPLFIRGALTEHGRRVLARAMSALSNSAGGLIIFGVDCRRVDGVDEAQRLVPTENSARAETETRGSIGELLQPAHDGIEVLAIEKADVPDSGHIAVRVPRSERRPHRSEAKDQKNYFKRVGTSSLAMEHYDIEDAFSRRGAPQLLLRTAFKPRLKTGDGRFDMLLKLAVENAGEASAKFVTADKPNRLVSS